MVLQLAAGALQGGCADLVLLYVMEVVWVEAGGDWAVLADLCLMEGASTVMAAL